ncbi:MAG: hypothetical protein AVDCRST_MAG20-2609, partial [uncultured Acidimicrobiales bacterium]
AALPRCGSDLRPSRGGGVASPRGSGTGRRRGRVPRRHRAAQHRLPIRVARGAHRLGHDPPERPDHRARHRRVEVRPARHRRLLPGERLRCDTRAPPPPRALRPGVRRPRPRHGPTGPAPGEAAERRHHQVLPAHACAGSLRAPTGRRRAGVARRSDRRAHRRARL